MTDAQFTRSHDKDMLIAGFKRDLAKERADNERLRAALKPFAELYGPYRYDGSPDDHVVRSAGTLGKDGDRGYAFITVADLRRADDLLRASHEQEAGTE